MTNEENNTQDQTVTDEQLLPDITTDWFFS